MKPVDISDCELTVFVCTNHRPGEKPDCARYGGQEFYQRIKSKLKDTGLNRTRWAVRTGCLGFCNPVGTTVAIERPGEERRWYNEVTDADFDTIWNEIVRK